MSDLISSGDDATEAKEAPADVKGMFQFAQAAFLGVMALFGYLLARESYLAKRRRPKKANPRKMMKTP